MFCYSPQIASQLYITVTSTFTQHLHKIGGEGFPYQINFETWVVYHKIKLPHGQWRVRLALKILFEEPWVLSGCNLPKMSMANGLPKKFKKQNHQTHWQTKHSTSKLQEIWHSVMYSAYNLQIIFASLIPDGFQICFLKMSRAWKKKVRWS